ncbi:MAG: NAD-dependent deacylase [Bacteroidota bacterium]
MKKIVILTGAGVSAESGIKTFRDHDGLWENHRIEDVATPDAWERDPELVMEFYNQRRKNLLEVEPNAAHYALAKLEEKYDVQVITQNVDNLHERAGSTKVLHLHGELNKARSTVAPYAVYPIEGWELNLGDHCEKGSQLRPHIVWFGEPVPLIMRASELAARADIVMVIGTSMVVYPAAGLIEFVPRNAEKYYIDPNAKDIRHIHDLHVIHEMAGKAVPALVAELLGR